MRYSAQSQDRIFVKGYEFSSFAKNMGRNIGKNIIKNLNCKCSPGMLGMSQEPLDHAKKSAKDVRKTSLKKSHSKNSRSN